MKPNQIIKDTAEFNYKSGYSQGKSDCLKEVLKLVDDRISFGKQRIKLNSEFNSACKFREMDKIEVLRELKSKLKEKLNGKIK